MMAATATSHTRARHRRVYEKHGAWYWVAPDTGQWIRLCSVADSEALLEERLRIEQRRLCCEPVAGIGNMPVLVAQYVREKTVEHREKAWPSYGRYVRDSFADLDVEHVDAGYVSEFLRANWAGKLAMQRVMRAFLSGFFQWCIENRRVTENPCRELRLKKPRPRRTYITDEHFAKIRGAMLETVYALADREVSATVPTGPTMQCFVDLCYLTAQRSTDVRLLEWSAVDRAGGVIHFVPSKTEDSSGAAVDVAITPEIAAVLDRAESLRCKGATHVVHRRDGRQFAATGVRSAWTRAVERAGLAGEGYTVKDIRAKALTDAMRAGHSIEDLKVMAAHADSRTTQIYVKRREVPVSSIRVRVPGDVSNDGQAT